MTFEAIEVYSPDALVDFLNEDISCCNIIQDQQTFDSIYTERLQKQLVPITIIQFHCSDEEFDNIENVHKKVTKIMYNKNTSSITIPHIKPAIEIHLIPFINLKTQSKYVIVVQFSINTLHQFRVATLSPKNSQ